MEAEYQYWVMDGRAADGTREGFDQASVMYCARTLQAAKDSLSGFRMPDTTIWRVNVVNVHEEPVCLGRDF